MDGTSRFVFAARPDQQPLQVTGLLPGRYLAAAVEFENGSQFDPTSDASGTRPRSLRRRGRVRDINPKVTGN
jgi:hypothetical protein